MWGQGPLAAIAAAALWRELVCCRQDGTDFWRESEGRARGLCFGHCVVYSPCSLDDRSQLVLFASLLISFKVGFCHVLSRSPAGYILITFPLCLPPERMEERVESGDPWVLNELCTWAQQPSLSIPSASSKLKSLVTLLLP